MSDATPASSPIDTTSEWAALQAHHATLAGRHLRDLLPESGRLEAMTVDLPGIHADLSKHRATPDTIGLLVTGIYQQRPRTHLRRLHLPAHDPRR